jgi:hypothetical protein
MQELPTSAKVVICGGGAQGAAIAHKLGIVHPPVQLASYTLFYCVDNLLQLIMILAFLYKGVYLVKIMHYGTFFYHKIPTYESL